MFEYRRIRACALRSVTAASLVLLLALGLSISFAAPAAAQVADSGSISSPTGSGGTTGGVTGQDVDEWENDILNGTAPSTSAGVVDQMTSLLLRAIDWLDGLVQVTQRPSK